LGFIVLVVLCSARAWESCDGVVKVDDLGGGVLPIVAIIRDVSEDVLMDAQSHS
jgi:hypothetical protein